MLILPGRVQTQMPTSSGKTRANNYFFAAFFFAAQKAFNLAESLALVAAGILLFVVLPRGFALRMAFFARRNFAHLAF